MATTLNETDSKGNTPGSLDIWLTQNANRQTHVNSLSSSFAQGSNNKSTSKNIKQEERVQKNLTSKREEHWRRRKHPPVQRQGQTCRAPWVQAATDKHPTVVCLGKTAPITMGTALITGIRGPCSSQKETPPQCPFQERADPGSGITTSCTCSESALPEVVKHAIDPKRGQTNCDRKEPLTMTFTYLRNDWKSSKTASHPGHLQTPWP